MDGLLFRTTTTDNTPSQQSISARKQPKALRPLTCWAPRGSTLLCRCSSSGEWHGAARLACCAERAAAREPQAAAAALA